MIGEAPRHSGSSDGCAFRMPLQPEGADVAHGGGAWEPNYGDLRRFRGPKYLNGKRCVCVCVCVFTSRTCAVKIRRGA